MTDGQGDLWTPDRGELKAKARETAKRVRYADPTGYRRQAGMVALPQHDNARRCSGCSGTLAQDQDTHHPGCVSQEAHT